MLAGRKAERLDALDAEWLYDGLHWSDYADRKSKGQLLIPEGHRAVFGRRYRLAWLRHRACQAPARVAAARGIRRRGQAPESVGPAKASALRNGAALTASVHLSRIRRFQRRLRGCSEELGDSAERAYPSGAHQRRSGSRSANRADAVRLLL